ncbi:MAG: Xaa-Pro peptidase family protein [Bacteroidota bacterium]
MISHRLTQLRARMQELSLDALLVTAPENVRYLSGFSGSNGMAVITHRRKDFLTDGRYVQQSAKEVRGFRLHVTTLPLLEEAARARVFYGCSLVGFEAHALSYAQYRRARSLFPQVRFRPTTDLVEGIALIKDRSEIAVLARAARIADRVFDRVLPSVVPGATELDISAEISWLIRRQGGEGDAFPPIVASGPRGAIPHARPTVRKIRKGEFVTLDFGVSIGGYRSDLSRTVAVGTVPVRLRGAYRAVQEAHAEAIRSARGGMRARDLDAVARTRITAAGFGKYFVHSLGHGLGLRVHERPRISALSREVLQTGSVITIEPGVYIPGVGGVRIEDDLVLRAHGCRLLTASPRELLIV